MDIYKKNPKITSGRKGEEALCLSTAYSVIKNKNSEIMFQSLHHYIKLETPILQML